MPLLHADQVTLDGTGYGLIRLPQAPPFRAWVYSRVSVSINTGEVSALTGGECRMYLGEPFPENFITGTRTPWLDTATLEPSASRITSPMYMSLEFTDCDPLSIATVSATYRSEPL